MSFDQLIAAHVGSTDAVMQLRRSIDRERLAHAYLFLGPRGSGKVEAAMTLAQALNCEREDHDACGRCDSCKTIASREHPDIHWVEPESKSRRIQIDQIREFERAVSLKANRARVKAGIVVDADCMSEGAANAFLKTLEEPPANTIIILLTAEPQRLLPTILSRCLRISFGETAGASELSPTRAKTLELLVEFASAPQPGIVHAYRLHAAVTSLLAAMKKEVGELFETEKESGRWNELEAEARGKLEDQLEARIEGEYRGRREEVLEEIYAWFADIVLCAAGAEEPALTHPQHHDVLQKAAAQINYDKAVAHLEAMERIRDAMSRNVNEPFALEVGLLKLVS